VSDAFADAFHEVRNDLEQVIWDSLMWPPQRNGRKPPKSAREDLHKFMVSAEKLFRAFAEQREASR